MKLHLTALLYVPLFCGLLAINTAYAWVQESQTTEKVSTNDTGNAAGAEQGEGLLDARGEHGRRAHRAPRAVTCHQS